MHWVIKLYETTQNLVRKAINGTLQLSDGGARRLFYYSAFILMHVIHQGRQFNKGSYFHNDL
jgi:hypothetical protein